LMTNILVEKPAAQNKPILTIFSSS